MSNDRNRHLIRGDQTLDIEMLKKMFLKLTGRPPTAEELMKARALLESSIKTGSLNRRRL